MGACVGKKRYHSSIPRRPSATSSTFSMSQLPLATSGPQADRLEQNILYIIHLLETDNQGEIAITLVLVHLNAIEDEGWLELVDKVVNIIPLEKAFGATAIVTIFEGCPLPSTETVLQLQNKYVFNRARALNWDDRVEGKRKERNLLLFLYCMAEKYAGPVSARLLTSDLIEYLVTFIIDHRDPDLMCHSMAAIEKFAKTKVNRNKITEYLAENTESNPLLALEHHSDCEDPQWRQVGFMARWLLDNIFLVDGRTLSYLTTKMTGVNAMLDYKGTTDNMKVGHNGLDARSDVLLLESVRSTFKVDDNSWYYEARILTHGVMQIGWAIKENISNHDGCGIGDDEYSIAYDGCRGLLWHQATAMSCPGARIWAAGDILGCLIDLVRQEAIFTLNGVILASCTVIYKSTSRGFFAAASLGCFQSATFNFGASEFMFPPADREFMTFNDHGTISDEDKQVIPRWLYAQRLRALEPEEKGDEDICNICYDGKADTIFSPCRHSGICRACAFRLAVCPMCRSKVWHYTVLPL